MRIVPVKQRVKYAVQSIPWLWNFYWSAKVFGRKFMMLRYHLYDAVITWRDMHWTADQTAPWSLSAELLFNYHKLEKGLVMPGKRRFFGVEPADRVMNLVIRWKNAGLPLDDPIYTGAIDTLNAYLQCLKREQLDPHDAICSRVDQFLKTHIVATINHPQTPRPVSRLQNRELATTSFRELLSERRSIRDFVPTPVPIKMLMDCIFDAQQSPSACNRQPCTVRLISDAGLKADLLALQNGNKGFGHLAPHIAVVMADATGFFDASERHQPYVDGGLFSMAFLLALQVRGISSCCLNWCVSPDIDRKAQKLLAISGGQRIIMLLAIGYAPEQIDAPLSPRRSVSSIVNLS